VIQMTTIARYQLIIHDQSTSKREIINLVGAVFDSLGVETLILLQWIYLSETYIYTNYIEGPKLEVEFGSGFDFSLLEPKGGTLIEKAKNNVLTT